MESVFYDIIGSYILVCPHEILVYSEDTRFFYLAHSSIINIKFLIFVIEFVFSQLVY